MIIEMIAEKILNGVFSVIETLLYNLHLNDIAGNFNTLFDYYCDILSYIYYFLPVGYLFPLIIVVFAVLTLRVYIALIRLIVSFFSSSGS